MSNDASGSRLPASLGLRYSGGNVDTRTTRCYEFIQVSVIAMLLGTLGAMLVARLPGTDCIWPCVKVISTALSYVGWSQSSSMTFPPICKLHPLQESHEYCQRG